LHKWPGLLAGIALFILIQAVNPFGVDHRAVQVLSVAALMITWWIAEALPMPVVALVPLVLFPLLKVSTTKEVAASYGDPSIFLFMGGFMLGLAIEKWNLHKRIALAIVNITGTSGDRIILGFILATGLLSMWLSNTATTMMMYPIAASVIHVVKENHNGNARLDNFALAIMLAIAYAANFGGIATIVGTPPNVALKGIIRETYDYTIGFADWMVIGTPIALLLLLSLHFVMTRLLYPSGLQSDAGTREHIRSEMAKLGPLSAQEKSVLVIFLCAAFLWMTGELINLSGFIKVDDTMIAMAAALALFICPAGKAHPGKKILEWSDTTKMAWGILLLFGGGIALASALQKAGLIQQLGQWVAGFSGSGFMLVLMITVVSLFISEVMSNIAQVVVFTPVVCGIADALGMNPLLLAIPMTLAASCASMMPMGTPPNAIVFASGYIRFNQMVRTGFVMNIIAVILITLFSWYIVPLLMAMSQ
jgi:anion transporter